MKLLIVEDNPEMRQLLKSIVLDLIDDIAECGDGAEAVAVYAAAHLSGSDFVLMDLQMANMGGLEATRHLIAADPQARVIIVTQYNDAHWRDAAREAGACGYVLKDNLLDVRSFLTEG